MVLRSLAQAAHFRRSNSHKVSEKLIRVQQGRNLDPNHLAMLSTFRLKPYPQMYPVLVVRGDGSSYRAWSMKEPLEIVKYPLDISKMSEMERMRLISKRSGKSLKTKFQQRVSLDEDDYEEEIADFDDLTD